MRLNRRGYPRLRSAIALARFRESRPTLPRLPSREYVFVDEWDVDAPRESVFAAISDARDALDHRLLNEVEGLTLPTLERISIWLWDRLHNRLPGLAEIEVARDSCHEGCVYRGPRPRLAAE